jgi:hypothetical protein
VRNNHDLDEKNLKFYLEKEQEQQRGATALTPRPTLHPEANTRKQFVDEKMLEIQKTHPNLTPKQVFTRANMLWKNSRK